MFGLVWYLPTWLFCSVLLISFLKKQSHYENIIIGIICIVIMGKLYLLTDNHALNITVEKTISFFSFGFLRGMLEIGIGCITAKFSNNIKIYNQIFGHIILFFLFLLFLLIIFYRKPTTDFDFIFLPLVSLLLIILDNKKLMFVDWLDSFGEYHKKLLDLSLPIYIFHQPVIMLFDKLNIQHRVRYLPIYLLMVCAFAFLGNQLNIILQTFLMNKKSCCNNL